MAATVVMPQMGYDMHQGRIVRWLKKEGETVTRGEPLAEIETDKAVVEMEAYESGVVRKIVAQEGATVPVGQVIAIITGPEEPLPADIEKLLQAPPAAVVGQEAAPETPQPSARATEATAEISEIRATPIARRLAQELGVDLATVKGTGPGGRITEQDVRAAKPGKAAPSPAALPSTGQEAVRLVEVSRMRQAIARLTTHSAQTTPHFYVTAEIDMTQCLELRAQINKGPESQGVRVSVNDMIVKACALALGKHSAFNSFYREGKLQLNPMVNIGIAIAVEEGLLVPAIPECNKKSLAQIARASKDLIERAQKGHLMAEEYTGGTFSVSNLGMYDVESFTAIIHPPQSGVLAVGSIRKVPVVRGDQVIVSQVMKVTLSVDHRVADGAQGARFLVEVKRLLENPASLLA
ncbi:MAG: 2-oxo acid dehydrogenase subunit E2 [Chloroflexi bacterium]|nr:2-oxo acid dehydrogenase subunit E2 [Chloroflexota bacterium]